MLKTVDSKFSRSGASLGALLLVALAWAPCAAAEPSEAAVEPCPTGPVKGTAENQPDAAASEPCITDPSKEPSIDTGKIPRFGENSPFDEDYEPPTVKKEKRLWANSYRWSKAPELIVERWLTEKPDTQGKYVLIEFWATWCPPCRRSIELLNGFHKKYGDELVVIGVSHEPEEDVRKLDEKYPNIPKIEFYSAVDTQSRTKDKLGVFGIPHVVLLEPDGYVIWEGFPFQEGFELTEDIIDKILEIGRKLRAQADDEKAESG
ncbi:MAG TPA: TlpA disulfide reductase family protein [Thermoguttaceae bacterium]|nr:TlpA disulfide reductase family protein [Thermoguttaceae bacterium]